MEIPYLTYQDEEIPIDALCCIVKFRNLESGQHLAHVQGITEVLLRALKSFDRTCSYGYDDIPKIARASAVHDIGKVGIPDSILLKPCRLSEEEYSIMKKHTVIGCEIIKQFEKSDDDLYRYCYDICRYHHERWDGRGYPDGLIGDQIPIWAQVVAIADVYDALVSPRIYKEPYSPEKAYAVILNGECGVFSPKLLECFKQVKRELFVVADAQANKQKC